MLREGAGPPCCSSPPSCAPCAPTRSLLASVAAATEGVDHVDLDLTRRPELATRYGIRQTPTTFVLDRRGEIVFRIGGAPTIDTLRAELSRALAATH